MDCLTLTGCCSELDYRLKRIEEITNKGTLFSFVLLKSLDDLPANPDDDQKYKGYIFNSSLYLYIGENQGTVGPNNAYSYIGEYSAPGVTNVTSEDKTDENGRTQHNINIYYGVGSDPEIVTVSDGIGIKDINYTSSDNDKSTNVTITFTDGSMTTVVLPNGVSVKEVNSRVEYGYDEATGRSYTINYLTFKDSNGNVIVPDSSEPDKMELAIKLWGGKDGKTVGQADIDLSHIVFHDDPVQEVLEIGNITSDDIVRYDQDQTSLLTEERQQIARNNVGACSLKDLKDVVVELQRVEEFLVSLGIGNFVANTDLFDKFANV